MPAIETKHLYIEKDPSKYEGRAVIQGTRIPVASLVNHYRSGMSIEEIIEGYPSLSAITSTIRTKSTENLHR